MPTAILLIAHGSRREEANRDLAAMAEMLRSRLPDEIIEIAYLELAVPTIPDGARRCVARGAAGVSLLPFFLSAGAHVADDLQQFCRQLTEQYPHVAFHVCPPLGLHPLLVDVLIDRLAEGRTAAIDRSR